MVFNKLLSIWKSVEFIWCFFAIFTFYSGTYCQDPDSTSHAALPDSVFAVVNESDSVGIDGLIIDKETGEFPAKKDIVILVDSLRITPDSTGSFSVRLARAQYHIVKVQAQGYSLFTQTIQTLVDKNNYFITCALEKQSKPLLEPSVPAVTIGPGWTISGFIADSRLDLAIDSTGAYLEFDKQYIGLTKNGSFRIDCKRGGTHTFHLIINGYHEVFQNIELLAKDPQPFVVIQTTKLKYALTRREITVSAKRQPIHITSTVAKTRISKAELKGTAATASDPMQVLATLPGVASESDASARPIVRGGDVLESRVFLDGVTLIQPYHYGGVRSILNQSAITNLSIYKSGFPAEFPNAQSAIITAESRRPTSEPLTLDFDANVMQYSAYLGVPLGKNKNVGINASVQGSYIDFMEKAAMQGSAFLSGNKESQTATSEYIKMITLPDYQDYSLGVEIKPSNKLSLYVNESYNTDWVKFTTRDSFETRTFLYNDGHSTSNTRTWSANPGFGLGTGDFSYWEPVSANDIDTSWSTFGVKIDTLMSYQSFYNNLYGTGKYLLTNDQVLFFTGAWQKRWWKFNFPRAFSSYFPNSRYDVFVDQFNASGYWLGTGFVNHTVKAGLNIDYTKAKYNVDMPRVLHQIITEGSTNFEDYWGPISNDTGMSISSNADAYGISQLTDRLRVGYNGFKKYYAGGIFLQDEWNITPKLTLDYGARLEGTFADSSITFSPRGSIKYSIRDNVELLAAAGHYTQNNYEVAALALSNSLKPEKVWHASVGTEIRILPWLTDKIDVYGKYYYDLISENVTLGQINPALIDSVYNWQNTGGGDSSGVPVYNVFNYSPYKSNYTNDGKGYSYGFENMLRYDPTTFWYGWLSFSLGTSLRQRHPGSRWYPFSLDKPLLISLVNYYRLPRKFEIGLKYRYMSGLPYTPVSLSNTSQVNSSTIVGPSNSRRYGAYQRLDFRISKGFNMFKSRGNFYIECWNAFNSPNALLYDSKTKEEKSFDLNIPITVLFVGLDFSL